MAQTTTWDPASYAQNARFVSDLAEPLLAVLDAKPRERILDLGCGDGALTVKIAERGSLVIGLDSSAALLETARRRGLQVVRMDAQCLSLKHSFDAVLSNAALHWMKQPEAVLSGVAGCLKPGGRFVGEFGGKGNVETIRVALHRALRKHGIDPQTVDPWYFPTREEYGALLAKFGFIVETIELVPRPTRLPGDLRDWLGVFAQPFTRTVPESARDAFVDEVCAAIEPVLRKPDGAWSADYVRLRFKVTRADSR